MRALRFDTEAAFVLWRDRRKQPQKVLTPSELIALEAREQTALVEWRDLWVSQIPALRWLFHCPNGELRDPNIARKLLKMGVLAGVADFIWLYPRNGYHGMVLELKSVHGSLSESQKEFLDYCRGAGYYACCCRGWTTARQALLNYHEEKVPV